MLDHAVVETQRGPPLDGKELDPLPRLDVEPREVLGHHGRDVVAKDVGVPDDGGVVDDLTDAVNDEHLESIGWITFLDRSIQH